MNVSIEKKEQAFTITIEGRLDTTNVGEFEKQIADAFKLAEPNILIDCKALDYISSSGLRIFLTLQKYVIAHKGHLTLLNMQSTIREVFDMTGFTKIFDIK